MGRAEVGSRAGIDCLDEPVLVVRDPDSSRTDRERTGLNVDRERSYAAVGRRVVREQLLVRRVSDPETAEAVAQRLDARIAERYVVRDPFRRLIDPVDRVGPAGCRPYRAAAEGKRARAAVERNCLLDPPRGEIDAHDRAGARLGEPDRARIRNHRRRRVGERGAGDGRVTGELEDAGRRAARA